jgi:hypothetical protein
MTVLVAVPEISAVAPLLARRRGDSLLEILRAYRHFYTYNR